MTGAGGSRRPDTHDAGAPGDHAGVTPHESPQLMTFPLVVLAVLSFVGGFINLPFVSQHADALTRWLERRYGWKR